MAITTHTNFKNAYVFLTKNTLRNICSIQVSNSLDPDQARHIVGPDLVQSVCKGYQQTTKTATIGERFKIL